MYQLGVAGGAVDVADVDALQLVAQRGPGVLGAGLGDAREQQSEEGQQHVGSTAVLLAMVDGPQVEDVLLVAPPALDLLELLVVARDLRGADVIGAAGEQELAVEVPLRVRRRRGRLEAGRGGGR